MSTTDLSSQVATLLSDLILKKPTTKADALLLLKKIELRLASFLVSELPAIDQQIVLGVRGLVTEVKTGCWKTK